MVVTMSLNLPQLWSKAFCFVPTPCEDTNSMVWFNFSAEGGVNLFTLNKCYLSNQSLSLEVALQIFR